jgi:flagellar assembly protein FliH
MSSSETEDAGVLTGRVILGPGGGGEAETTVAELEARRSPVHYEEVEAQFWERVRGKATAKASEIMTQAMAEAERIKAKAQEDGYAAGVAAAEKQIQAELVQMSQSLGTVLESVAGERKKLWSSYRQDLVTLLRLAVERTIAVSLDARRQEILAGLLDESLELIDAQDGLTLTVHPDDEGFVRELMARAVAERPGVGHFQVRVNPALLPGSISLESRDGLVDNTVASRFESVETLFAQLAASGSDAP